MTEGYKTAMMKENVVVVVFCSGDALLSALLPCLAHFRKSSSLCIKHHLWFGLDVFHIVKMVSLQLWTLSWEWKKSQAVKPSESRGWRTMNCVGMSQKHTCFQGTVSGLVVTMVTQLPSCHSAACLWWLCSLRGQGSHGGISCWLVMLWGVQRKTKANELNHGLMATRWL